MLEIFHMRFYSRMNYLFLTLFFFQCAAAGLEFEWTETLCGVQYQATGLDTAVDVSTGRTVAVKFVKTTEKIHENELLLQVLKMKLFSGDENFVQLICHHVRCLSLSTFQILITCEL